MRVKDSVRVYENDWFNEGLIIEIKGDFVLVDFLDWKQLYHRTELRMRYVFFKKVWIAEGPGETVEDFRN
jgi:hypothetical protein